jgi:isopropylmalate/homocitrate/citramalate synthase
MEQLVLEWQNVELLLKYGSSFVLGILAFFGYLKKAGIKLAPMEKAIEYRELKELRDLITKNISKEEFLQIVRFVIQVKKENKPITVEVVSEAGKMLFDAITTEEKK